MSSTVTVCTIIISRLVMQSWARRMEREVNPFGGKLEVTGHVVATHHRAVQPNRPIRHAPTI